MVSDDKLLDEWDFLDDLDSLRCDMRSVQSETDLGRVTLESQIRVMLKELIVGQDLEELTSYMVSESAVSQCVQSLTVCHLSSSLSG